MVQRNVSQQRMAPAPIIFAGLARVNPPRYEEAPSVSYDRGTARPAALRR